MSETRLTLHEALAQAERAQAAVEIAASACGEARLALNATLPPEVFRERWAQYERRVATFNLIHALAEVFMEDVRAATP